MTASKFISSFKDIDKHDVDKVGGKGANLGEMTKAKFPVPPGFVVTVEAYKFFMEQGFLGHKISSILASTDVDNPQELASSSKQIQKLIGREPVPKVICEEIVRYYKKLSGLFKNEYVAVRSSATAEDLPNASFAGQQASFLNVKGDSNLILAVRSCWAALFTARSIFYRVQNKISHHKVSVAVVIQKMIQSEASGVMFTIDPVTNDKDAIIIEAIWGLGEMIVQGEVIPDRYKIQKETNAILVKQISEQNSMLVRKNDKNLKVPVVKNKIGAQKITNDEIIWLAKLGEKLQKHYYFPQDVEWHKEAGKIYIVQTRPVTTMSSKFKVPLGLVRGGQSSKLENGIITSLTPVLKGVGASPGIGTGRVKILTSFKELAKISQGDILVAKMTSPDFVPAMKKASAILTDEGGLTSHAAIVSRELGIPCVVGSKTATQILPEGSLISINGSTGEVFMGTLSKTSEDKTKEIYPHHATATKLYVNLGEPERAREIAKQNVDGVGLLRAEFMIAQIGIHPKEAIKRKEQFKFVDLLKEGIATFCKEFYPRPVIYRATDFRTNEYRRLKGGESWEPEEPNPMLGYRGAYRFIADPEVFNLELSALKAVREKYNNLSLMIPFVRSVEELTNIRKLVAIEGFFKTSSFKFWMMVELPVNVIMFEEFVKVGIDGISFGSNDLTMLIHGVDRDNRQVASEYNERSPAVLWALKRVITSCNNHAITSSICGQAPSVYDDMVEFLIKSGITSISVNPDSIDRVRNVIYNVERLVISK
ncbi:MAG: phosphoenolpyruvate synthase [Patescibacteria group bacterium]